MRHFGRCVTGLVDQAVTRFTEDLVLPLRRREQEPDTDARHERDGADRERIAVEEVARDGAHVFVLSASKVADLRAALFDRVARSVAKLVHTRPCALFEVVDASPSLILQIVDAAASA